MPELPRCYGIIPARYGSTRFPGKPLADILGKPMFWHVFKRASQCNEIDQVVLATDDKRIATAAKTLDVPVVMTRSDHVSGTDRVLEAAEKLNVPKNAVVVNIQGDEPALDPAMLTELILPFTDPNINVSTLAQKIDLNEAKNPDRVKVVLAKDGRALYFSRSLIPYHRDQQGGEFYGHIGLYAFRMSILKRFVSMGPSDLELTERLEQLRLLESGIPIHVVKTEHRSFGVDRPSDIEIVTRIIMQG
ncbi:MAG: 3-deoxy-manno-octulosonate cytidylyltransferase [Desulfobacterales bacterium]|nr:MAG: 3-deoxy-manno-octulosonate cytidylyltransferase [Desulfobacterales bacterium]